MTISKAGVYHLDPIVALAKKLWPNEKEDDLAKEFYKILQDGESAIFFVEESREIVGFAQCQLRKEYVEGTNSSPVGYLEGIYLEPEYRGQGIAGQLLDKCEEFAKENGCTEFASDIELENEASYHFHDKNGFVEVNRIIHFTKALE